MFLICFGLSGTGKTTFAKEFAKLNNFIYLSLDDLHYLIEIEKSLNLNVKNILNKNTFNTIKVFSTFFYILKKLKDKNLIIDSITHIEELKKIIEFTNNFEIKTKKIVFENKYIKNKILNQKQNIEMEIEFKILKKSKIFNEIGDFNGLV